MKDPAETLVVTLIQSSLYWEDKTANLDQFEAKIRSAEGKKEIVILPEMFSTGFTMQPETLAETMEGPSVRWMQRVSRENRVVIAGSLIIEEKGHYYNRLIWMLPSGDCGYYDKKHLFAFAGEDRHYTAGAKRLIASVKGWKVNLLVCYDLRFPVWSRQQPLSQPEQPRMPQPEAPGQNNAAVAEYDLLIYVANWPERRRQAWQTLLQARAIENQSYVVGVNRVGTDGNDIYYSGDSMIVDPLGEILYSRTGEEDVCTYTLSRKRLEEIREKMPFLRDADPFVLGM